METHLMSCVTYFYTVQFLSFLSSSWKTPTCPLKLRGENVTSSLKLSLTTPSGLTKNRLDTPCFPFLWLPGMTLVTWYYHDVFSWQCTSHRVRPLGEGFFFSGLFLYTLHRSQQVTHSRCTINVGLNFR